MITIRYNGDLPLPNELLGLKELHKMKFYNTSFREYLCVYGDYIIGVYPFAIKVDKAFDNDGNPITYEQFSLLGVRSHHHHSDFTKGVIDVDPCDIFEKVCGIRIHQGESDNHLKSIDYSNDIRGFNAEIISERRDSKLNDLGI